MTEDRPSVFWDDLNEDMQDLYFRIAYGRESRKIKWIDRLMNYVVLPLASFVRRCKTFRTKRG